MTPGSSEPREPAFYSIVIIIIIIIIITIIIIIIISLLNTRKGPFIATQLNSTRRRFELSCVAIENPHRVMTFRTDR